MITLLQQNRVVCESSAGAHHYCHYFGGNAVRVCDNEPEMRISAGPL